MACWLYQMKAEEWPHERYRAEVWEGAVTTNWKVGKIEPHGGMPQYGDIIILFYVRTDKIDPGIYGWGIILWCNGDDIHFRPAPPSDYLKMNPIWDNQISQAVDKIRGGMKMGTMWDAQTVQADLLKIIRQKIAEHVYRTPLSP